ncbi:hypothetical protein L3V35_05075 [Vibrio sp. L5-1]|uniref:hypothetical protein n=1 Tax=Vibrio sp. L5-1 TaxID=2912254 RepID=UPI001F38D9F7|nr:hypothetical protein [Vibrio sp. L5-1]MCF7494420.1 hypothetical protein [Vibrio sp. L5-1]
MEKYILLSIRPHYVREIISGAKKFEFRKKFPSLYKSNVSSKVIIYCSKPVMAIVGSFVVKHHHHSDFSSLMYDIGATEEYSNRISKYLTDKKSCHALEISDLIIYEKELSLQNLRSEFEGFCPGQSYRYLDHGIIDKIKKLNSGVF